MIKINLLEVERERRPRATVTAGSSQLALVALGVFGVAAAVFLLWFLRVSAQAEDLARDVEQKRQKKKELEPYIKRVDELEKRRNELLKKNTAIETLRSQRTIPVHILDEVSRALPEYLWLTRLSLKQDVLTIDGETLQEQAIPAFMNNLAASEFVGDNVSLIQTARRGDATSATPSTNFTISAPITNPFKPKTEPAAAPTQ